MYSTGTPHALFVSMVFYVVFILWLAYYSILSRTGASKERCPLESFETPEMMVFSSYVSEAAYCTHHPGGCCDVLSMFVLSK